MSQAVNAVKNWRNLSISNCNLLNINACTRFGLVTILWHLLQLSPGNENMGVSRADNSIKFDEICPLAFPNQISIISMHVHYWWNLPISIPKPDVHNINALTKFGENPLMFTQVISQKWNTDGRTTDRRPTWNHDTPPLSCGGAYYHATIVWWAIKRKEIIVLVPGSGRQDWIQPQNPEKVTFFFSNASQSLLF